MYIFYFRERDVSKNIYKFPRINFRARYVSKNLNIERIQTRRIRTDKSYRHRRMALMLLRHVLSRTHAMQHTRIDSVNVCKVNASFAADLSKNVYHNEKISPL